MKEISATTKGLITGALMVLISFGMYSRKTGFENWLMYIIYAVYIAGILWTLLGFRKIAGNTTTFKEYFSQAFKCFIVVTLIMVLFNWIFIVMNPQLKEQMIADMRNSLSKEKDLAPIDIEGRITNAKKMFLPGYIMGAVLVYLSLGALVSVISSVFLSQNKQNNFVNNNGTGH